MGSRGAMMKPPSERVQSFLATGTIAGYKVLEPLNKTKNDFRLPSMSNTPNTGYIRLTADGRIAQFKQYGPNRHQVILIDFTHDHGHGIPHVRDFDKDGNKIKGKKLRPLTLEERKKYATLLKAAGF